MKNITDIIRAYTEGKTTLEDANAKHKVRVADGHLDQAVNEVSESGTVTMPAWVYLDGKQYAVKGDALEEC